MSALALAPAQLAAAAGVVFAVGASSLALGLRLERQLAINATRAVLQLLAVGYVLHWIFRQRSPAMVLLGVFVMLVAATITALGRSRRTYPGAFLSGFLTLLASGVALSLFGTQVVLAAKPWWSPRYLLPLLGMVLGKAMTSVSLSLDDLLQSLDKERDEVEMALALGASGWEATSPAIRRAIIRGTIPIINAMAAAGVVSFPGMMTGQILSGTSPLVAVRYQIMILFLAGGACSAASIATCVIAYRRLLTSRHQLRVDLIQRK